MKIRRFVRELTVENNDSSKSRYSLVYIDAEGEFETSEVFKAEDINIEGFYRELAGYQYLEKLLIVTK